MKRDFEVRTNKRLRPRKRVRPAAAAALLCMGIFLTGCVGENFPIRETGRESAGILLETGEPETGSIEEDPSEEPAGQDRLPFLSEQIRQASRFAYESLTEEEKLWYLKMEQALGNMEEQVRLPEEGIAAGMDETDIDGIFQCVLNDHPELFFVEGYTYTKYSRGDKLLAVDFAGAYSMDREEALARKREIEAGAAVMLAGISQDASEYEKVKYVYETIIKNTDYDLNSSDNQNIYSVFVNHSSVCQGYAKAAQYLLNMLGMECTLVMGTVDTGESHAWNLVKVDGSFYYLDTTWGDASYRMEEPEGEADSHMPEINYDYLCVTTQDLLRTHTLGGAVPMPECVDNEANYYVREGALFSSYDREQMKGLFDRARERGLTDVTVKSMDMACFQEIYKGLIEAQEIFDYMTGDERTVAYTHNEKQLSLTFWVTNE